MSFYICDKWDNKYIFLLKQDVGWIHKMHSMLLSCHMPALNSRDPWSNNILDRRFSEERPEELPRDVWRIVQIWLQLNCSMLYNNLLPAMYTKEYVWTFGGFTDSLSVYCRDKCGDMLLYIVWMWEGAVRRRWRWNCCQKEKIYTCVDLGWWVILLKSSIYFCFVFLLF